MSASITTLKLHATSPATAGARTFAAVLPFAIGTAARRDSTGAHPPTWRGRGAVFPFVSDLAWSRAKPVDIAPRDFLTLALMRQMTHVDILVPLADNEADAFPQSAFNTLEHFFTELCGGFTRRGDVEGAWRSPETGEVMRDRSRSYVVTLPVEEAEEQIARIESFIRRFFRQEAAFLELSDTRATVF